MEMAEMGKSGDGFIDRSKVRILLCENDAKSSEEVFTLLCRCFYQVTSVRSPRQVVDALNAEGADIDIILSEVDLPMSKGLKMLKYITRDKELRRIPVIMMSAKDEVSVVVKCLKLGAADYLVKPLRTNELLNLWTHMWRRRQMLGLAEKNILNYDFDIVGSDPSDANTNSTTLFSDDTDEKSRKACTSNHQEDEVTAATAPPIAFGAGFLFGCQPDVPGISDKRTGQLLSFPRKSELKIGESSAFFTYVKSSLPKAHSFAAAVLHENICQQVTLEEKLNILGDQVIADPQARPRRDAIEIHSPGDDVPSNASVPDSVSLERSCTPPLSLEAQQRNSSDFSQASIPQRNESHNDVSSFPANAPYPYYIPGVMNQVMMSPTPMYQKNMPDLHSYQAMLSQYGHVPQCSPHVPGMASFPYYPVGLCMQPGQISSPNHAWPSYGNSSSVDAKPSKIDRREAALIKFRQKRKERCFDKKIRYVNRKKLAERRPRVRGQFVRKKNGVTVDLNGLPASVDDDDDVDVDEEDDEDEECNMDSSL